MARQKGAAEIQAIRGDAVADALADVPFDVQSGGTKAVDRFKQRADRHDLVGIAVNEKDRRLGPGRLGQFGAVDQAPGIAEMNEQTKDSQKFLKSI